MSFNYVALFFPNIGRHDPGKMKNSTENIRFLIVTQQRSGSLTFMGIELHRCIFAADGLNLSKISHGFASVTPQIELLAPLLIKIFITQLLMNKCFLKSCFFEILNL